MYREINQQPRDQSTTINNQTTEVTHSNMEVGQHMERHEKKKFENVEMNQLNSASVFLTNLRRRSSVEEMLMDPAKKKFSESDGGEVEPDDEPDEEPVGGAEDSTLIMPFSA